ncbi:Actin, larval muscle,Actin, clone 403,Actin, alpha sarcomeric/skeletal,Actin-2, muscle-specific,Actin, cytoskeletal 3A,Beta-actin-like protein 2,Actin, indirect flight muscle,Actin, cytoskeletal 1A,Actin-42A,Actin-4,Putative actin-22,Actin, alpha skeletal muscle 3,Actin, cytoskeletal 1B,Actin, muscle-type A2,Major actin,Actin, adductor muscle,Actin CyI, cytoplasmic,Actin, cytoplasmic,Actin, gamma,Actin, alpha cardiac,Actin, alpha skeletal muscle,Actin-6,Actin A,Actin, cytoskeletal 3B,Actin, clone 302,Actin|uniref:Uncharacterized protein n=1 Tax=Mytilus coruscus TaxID=42192 RepID=A0A6J8B3A4_MYTCO|nr:Actin, larval muscle,Actin, clone 403,Actin, alpha sarcomeric/skeletal,Actin-2, muscle-specific,Actin, cytoskeletal 3A,Beta-actin-like protein 2,Actin, indirect flight muscle,Actin, cytoskeletal 1A,Actin-42A,Actin-4,Putative actin-22,Actin, alpha skeletal muscle 3,Actin, cytoskeletal 1B,Actin, muscle-type A2,Major actin,Actin, adductor muscle,Actin CyI, cytoplasmic,Actin, cytoplasmic,Actin, gamma,Actin, alpha cardiac,Actin, alpha skeletal muscle,Actin-6,Actin A,Actin, cytoskeletal 3B,Actin, clon
MVLLVSGHCILPATRRLEFGGRDLTLNLQQLLHKKGYDFVNNSELEIVREMKEKLCYVAFDCEQEVGNARDEKFELPDGNTITIGKERFICLDALFKHIPVFPERIRKGMESFVPRTTKVKVIANQERKSSVWIGGSILGSLSTFQTYWITKQEYKEYGPTIVHRRD